MTFYLLSIVSDGYGLHLPRPVRVELGRPPTGQVHDRPLHRTHLRRSGPHPDRHGPRAPQNVPHRTEPTPVRRQALQLFPHPFRAAPFRHQHLPHLRASSLVRHTRRVRRLRAGTRDGRRGPQRRPGTAGRGYRVPGPARPISHAGFID